MKLSSGSPGKYVRRKNKNGDYYYQERKSGKRVSKQKWEKDRVNVSKKVYKNRQEKELKISNIREKHEKEPFPRGVSEQGVPQKKHSKKRSSERVHKGLTDGTQAGNVSSQSATAATRAEAGRPLVKVSEEMEGEAIDLDFEDDFVPFAIEGEDETG